MSLELFHDTIAAIATAEGRGALGIIRISGADAIRIVSKVVSDPIALLAARGGTAIYTNIRGSVSGARGPLSEDRHRGLGQSLDTDRILELVDTAPDSGSRTSDHATIDDVVIHVYRGPRSYTGEDLCEITAHGSPVIAREIVDLLVANGARLAEPGEFSRRAFFNGKIGIERAELISIKADAQSEQELRGAELALSEKFVRLRSAYDMLISLIAQIDAEIDFGESDEIEVSYFGERVAEVSSLLRKLLRDSQTRRENAGYFTVALTGPPNVGKSSIFNALLNFERSIVSEVPGTTRDYVEGFINVDGFRVKLVDTAGLRATEELLEARGMALGTSAARHADITLQVTEPSERVPALTNGTILLHNKIDLDGWNESLRVSALTGEGIDTLHSWISSQLRERVADFSQVRLSETETMRLNSIADSMDDIRAESEPPIFAEDLRNAASSLAELLGMNISEDSLNYIFSKMCIGK